MCRLVLTLLSTLIGSWLEPAVVNLSSQAPYPRLSPTGDRGGEEEAERGSWCCRTVLNPPQVIPIPRHLLGSHPGCCASGVARGSGTRPRVRERWASRTHRDELASAVPAPNSKCQPGCFSFRLKVVLSTKCDPNPVSCPLGFKVQGSFVRAKHVSLRHFAVRV